MTRKKVDAAHPSPENPGEEPSGPDVMGDYLEGGWQVDEAGRWASVRERVAALRARMERLGSVDDPEYAQVWADLDAVEERYLGTAS